MYVVDVSGVVCTQVRRIREHQIVISPHGAQMTNIAFAARCTVST